MKDTSLQSVTYVSFYLKFHNYVSCYKKLEKINTHIFMNYCIKAKYRRTNSKQSIHPSKTWRKIETLGTHY